MIRYFAIVLLCFPMLVLQAEEQRTPKAFEKPKPLKKPEYVSIVNTLPVLTEKEKREIPVYISSHNPYYHFPTCYTISEALKNKNYRRVLLAEAHHTHAPCPHCPHIPKLVEPRNPGLYVNASDPYHLSKPALTTAPVAHAAPSPKP